MIDEKIKGEIYRRMKLASYDGNLFFFHREPLLDTRDFSKISKSLKVSSLIKMAGIDDNVVLWFGMHPTKFMEEFNRSMGASVERRPSLVAQTDLILRFEGLDIFIDSEVATQTRLGGELLREWHRSGMKAITSLTRMDVHISEKLAKRPKEEWREVFFKGIHSLLTQIERSEINNVPLIVTLAANSLILLDYYE